MTTGPVRNGEPLVMAHGAGSTADFLARAFPAAVCGTTTAPLDDRTGSLDEIRSGLRAAIESACRAGARPIVGGMSLGAHAAAFESAAEAPGTLAGCVLALPAWTGLPATDHPTARAATEVAEVGASAVLERLGADPALAHDWVVRELELAWRDRPTLARELSTAAVQPAPTVADLARIRVPTLVLALADDPMHPLVVAEQWAGAIPGAVLAVVPRDAPGDDRAVFGAAVGVWWRSTFSGPR